MDESAGPRRDALIAEVAAKSGWPEPVVRDYYLNVMIYEMDARMLQGFREFQSRLIANGFHDCNHFPALIGSATPEALETLLNEAAS